MPKHAYVRKTSKTYDRWIAQRKSLNAEQSRTISGAFKRHIQFLTMVTQRAASKTGVPFDFLFDFAVDALMRSALKFDPNRPVTGDPTRKVKELVYIGEAIKRGIISGIDYYKRRHGREIPSNNIFEHAEKPLKPLPAPESLANAQRQTLQWAVSQLKPNEAFVLIHRFGIGGARVLTRKAIAKYIGRTGSRVGQIESAAFKKLKDIIVSK